MHNLVIPGNWALAAVLGAGVWLYARLQWNAVARQEAEAWRARRKERKEPDEPVRLVLPDGTQNFITARGRVVRPPRPEDASQAQSVTVEVTEPPLSTPGSPR